MTNRKRQRNQTDKRDTAFNPLFAAPYNKEASERSDYGMTPDAATYVANKCACGKNCEYNQKISEKMAQIAKQVQANV